MSSVNPAEVELPFELVAKVASGAPLTSYSWRDSLGGSSNATAWELEIAVPGDLTVTLEVTDAAGDRGITSLTLSVQPRLSVSVSSPLAQVDTGVPAPFFINVLGGVPPLRASWVPSGGGPGGNATWPTDGNYSEEVSFSQTGPAWILVRVSDDVGDSASADQRVAEAVAPGALALATNGSVTEVGWPLGVAVAVDEGAPPFHWSLTSSLPLGGGSPTLGVFPSDGAYRWNLTFAFPGAATLNLTTTDSVGSLLTTSTAVVVEPPLSIELSTPGLEPSTPFEVSANVSGGLSPYAYQFRLSDGETAVGTDASAGLVSTYFDPRPDANYSLELRVTDQLGQSAFTTESLRVGGSTLLISDPPSADLSTYGGVAVLGGLLLLAAFYLYRRFGRAPEASSAPEHSALSTVRRLMKQSQIIDRETLVLLCEEAGETPEDVQAALQVLFRTSEVSRESGSTRDEVLRWTGAGSSGSPDEAPP